MRNKHGDFVWYELTTNDADAAEDFYGAVIGWSFSAAGNDDMDYREFSMNNAIVGGLLPLTSEMASNGDRPCWMGYICVDDVDKSVDRIKKAGGTIRKAPQDIPDVGRFASVVDPQGVMFHIIAGADDMKSSSFAAVEPMVGHCAWNELVTTDQAGAVAFYSDLFGWRQEGDMDMGPAGSYQFFYQGKHMIAGVMANAPAMPMPVWSYYFRVPNIDNAISTINSKGGQVLQDPIEIPGGDFAMSGIDPQGAAFALVGARK